MNDWMLFLRGLNNAAIKRVETTMASCGSFPWPVSVWRTDWVIVTAPKYTSASIAVREA
jgi:hypothetical protein